MTTNFYKALHSLDLDQIGSITVDVFDTILLRDLWPEELQFVEVAEAWLPLLRSEIEPTITAYEVLTFRAYARRSLLASLPSEDAQGEPLDREISISVWFTELVHQLAEKYEMQLSASQAKHLVQELTSIELQIESRHLRGNQKLARALRELKHTSRAEGVTLPVYFVSDMYLHTEQVEQLLHAAGIGDLFDGGITSADSGVGKYSGKMYRYLEGPDGFEGFQNARNLHIGDNRQSDYHAPIAEGSRAHHYWTLHHRRRQVRERKGRRNLEHFHRHHRRELRRERDLSTRDLTTAVRVGTLFAPALVNYVHTYSTRARLRPDTHFVGVSSEAVVFEQAREILFEDRPENMTVVATINRKAVMRAAVVRAASLGKDYALSVARLIEYGEGTQHHADVVRFIGGVPAELFSSHMPERERREYVWQHLDALEGREMSERISIDLRLDDFERIVLLDVGWGGTIQVFVREFAALSGYRGEIQGLYMGVQAHANRFGIDRGPMEGLLFENVLDADSRSMFVPEIWEYVLSDKKQYNASARHRSIHGALLDAVGAWKRIGHAAPDAYWEATKPELRRLLKKPTKDEVELLGSIEFDSGFNTVKYVPLVDMSERRLRMWAKSILRPRRTLVQLVQQYCWTRGVIRYYRLHHLTLIYRVIGKIRGKHYL